MAKMETNFLADNGDKIEFKETFYAILLQRLTILVATRK